jgi:hypothetical protein
MERQRQRSQRSQVCFRKENVKVNERGQNRTIANTKTRTEHVKLT